MASNTCLLPLRCKIIRPSPNWLSRCIKEPSRPHLRSMASQTSLSSSPPNRIPGRHAQGLTLTSDVPAHLAPKELLTTLYSFPSLTPVKFLPYSRELLGVPLRKDILHRAVVYEGDMTRQGSANTKWRSEVHGSNRKIRPQKGSGRARLGDKKSPMLRGGGAAFGPKPRDFATDLPKKVYGLAFRTALSYRYRKGELVVVDNLQIPKKGVQGGAEKYWLEWCLRSLKWDNMHGRSLFVPTSRHEDNESFFNTLNKERGRDGQARSADEVDVKNLLEMGRVVIEWQALNQLLKTHGPAQPFKSRNVGEFNEGLIAAQEALPDFVEADIETDLDAETADVEDILASAEEDLEATFDLEEEDSRPRV